MTAPLDGTYPPYGYAVCPTCGTQFERRPGPHRYCSPACRPSTQATTGNRSGPVDWTQERLDLVERMWAEGYRARQIAEKIGGGCTRNAVIGKAHRLGLVRGAEVAPPPEPQPPEPPPIEPAPMPRGKFKTWMCRWPTHEPNKYGLHICGNTAQPGRHYCNVHLNKQMKPNKRANEFGGGAIQGASSLA